MCEICSHALNHGARVDRILKSFPMANTYTQLYVQMIFAVQNRMSLISPAWQEELQKYITGIIQNHKHKMIIINGVEDHLHLFAGIHPSQSISDVMRIVKGDSSAWINKQKLIRGRFTWQEGFGAFSYSRNDFDRVYSYIANQKEHHKTRSFFDEYTGLLTEFGIEYDERYVFKKIE